MTLLFCIHIRLGLLIVYIFTSSLYQIIGVSRVSVQKSYPIVMNVADVVNQGLFTHRK